MKPLFVLLAVGLFTSQVNAQNFYSTCQQAFGDAQALALYNTYGTRSIKSDIDRIQDISDNLDRSLDSLRYISQSSSRVDQIAGTIGNKLDSGMVPKVQAAFNHNYNTQRILESALQKYESQLKSNGLGDVVNHLRNALSQAAQTEVNAKGAERDANGVKAQAQQLEASIRSETQSISRRVSDQVQYLERGNSSIQWLTGQLVGPNYRWGTSADPYSKLGTLERILNYMQVSSCIR